MNNKIPNIVIVAFVLAFILPIIGLILGIIALNKVNKTEEKNGKGLAIASIVIGAILTIPAFLIFVGAIAYFGVMSPSTFIPERCTIGTGFECDVLSIETNQINLQLENLMGRELVITKARILHEDILCVDSSEKIIDNNEQMIFSLGNCDLSDLPNRVSFDIQIDYYPKTAGEQFKNTAEGNFIAQIN